MKLGIGVSVAKPPFRVKLLHQVKSPYEILLGCPAPNSDRVVLVCEFVEKLVRLLIIRVQDAFRRAKHLHSLQQNFADVFVHHVLGNLPLNERKDEEVHITLVIVNSSEKTFQFYYKKLKCFLSYIDNDLNTLHNYLTMSEIQIVVIDNQSVKEAKKLEKEAKKAEKDAKKVENEAKKVEKDAKKVEEQALKDQEQAVKAEEQAKDIAKFLEFVSKNENSLIVLVRQKEVVQWLFGDLSFLPAIDKKNKTADEDKYKVLEDEWGQAIMKERRPDLKLDKQWTNRFGEYICEEIYTLLGKVVTKPVKKEHYQPDSEVDDAILEAKAQTFYTSGTAGEKILGSPFKYAEIPQLYGKPLKILCMGGAEKVCRVSYGNLPGARCSAQKQKFIDFFRQNGIEYIGASDILRSLSL